MNEVFRLRIASPKDAKALLDIYAPYVKQTAITFEYEVPSVQEFTKRIQTTLKKYPYLIVESDDTILGYTYASPFKNRAAYDWAVETTIYIAQGQDGKGLGRLLYTTLERILLAQNILNLNACIAYPAVEDIYLTRNSMQFHAHMGYHLVGEFHQCSYKFHRWYNMIWMEKHIAPHLENQPPIIPFPNLREQLEQLLPPNILH